MNSNDTPARTPLAWSDRIGALCGAAYVLLVLVGNQIASGGGESAHPTGAEDLAALARRSTSGAVRVGEALEIAGMVAFAFFLGWIVQALRRRGGAAGWLATTALVGGLTTLAVKFSSVMPVVAGTLDHDQLDATTARVLVDQNGAGFGLTFLTFGIFLLAGALAILSSGLLGRVAGWSGVVAGAAGIIEVCLGASTLDVNPIPFLVGLIWVLVVSITLGVRGVRAPEPTLRRVEHATA